MFLRENIDVLTVADDHVNNMNHTWDTSLIGGHGGYETFTLQETQ